MAVVTTFTLCEITNPHENFRKYVGLSADLMKKYGGKYLVRGKPQDGADEPFVGKFLIGIEFPSEEAAAGFAKEYEEGGLRALRDGSGTYQHAVFDAPVQ